jgi:Nse4 C-terminal
VQTVENIFDFSFDIKEGLAELSRDTVSLMYMHLCCMYVDQFVRLLYGAFRSKAAISIASTIGAHFTRSHSSNSMLSSGRSVAGVFVLTYKQTQLNCASINICTAMLQLLIPRPLLLLLLPLLLLLLLLSTLLLQATGALKLQRREALMDEKTSAKNNQTVLSFNLQDYYDMIELYNLEGKAPVIPARTGADYFDPLEKQPDVPDDDAAADDDSDSGAYYCCCCCLPCMTHCCVVCATVYVQREGSSIAALVPQCVAVKCRCIKHAFNLTAAPPLISLY